MNSYIQREIKKSNIRTVGVHEDDNAEIVMVIAAAICLVIAIILMKINIYDVIFSGIDAINLGFRSAIAFVSGIAKYFHLDVMAEQFSSLF